MEIKSVSIIGLGVVFYKKLDFSHEVEIKKSNVIPHWTFHYFLIFYSMDLYNALISSTQVSLGLPGLQASA
jgi:hypothetical protein